MTPAGIDTDLARQELERVLASSGFAKKSRLGRFLRFVVERHIEDRDDEIKESVLAVEVFGRSTDHDPKRDPIVRTEAIRLRARLGEYYANGGSKDPVVIELPKGGYVPVLRHVVAAPETTAPAVVQPPRLVRRWLVAGVSLAAIILTAAGWWYLHSRSAPIPIAVLPLVNLSQEPNSDYFADALTGEIIRDLSILDGLLVRSQTSSFAFKDKPQNVREAGNQLGADYILEGSVLRDSKRLRIDAQLVRVRDDVPIWSDRYDREMTDVFAIQDEISRGIVNSLRLKLGRGRRRYETSAEAYDFYLRARALEIASYVNGRNQSVGLYENAIAKDPSFAPAYAALAAAYAYRTGEDRMNPWAVLSRDEEIARMHAVVAKAIELDPLLAEAHAALGMVQAHDAQWEQSEKSFRRALDLEPNRSQTRTEFARNLLMPLGRIPEAVKRKCCNCESTNPNSRSIWAFGLIERPAVQQIPRLVRRDCSV